MLEEFSATISSNIFSSPFSLSSPSGTPIRQMLVNLMLSQRFFRLSSFFFRRRRWHPTPVLLPGKSHGQRSLVGCCPQGREESDTTERAHFHFSLSCIGEGNGNPLQCSCLENPRNGSAWWAAIYGVTQSWTRLKQLSSISIFFSFIFLYSVLQQWLPPFYPPGHLSIFLPQLFFSTDSS